MYTYPCSADTLSRYIVNICIDEGMPISNLQLQKILYFCQIEYLRKTSAFLFEDDFQAWRYGPVIPSVYSKYSIWGGTRIVLRNSLNSMVSPVVARVVDPVIKEKRMLKPWELVDQTHKPGSPWYITYNNGLGDGNVINKTLLMEATSNG